LQSIKTLAEKGWDALNDAPKFHVRAIALRCGMPLRFNSARRQSCLAASVIDGDTLEIHGTRIRLWGIDAPESSQLCRGDDSLQFRCGAKAANDLDTFIGDAGRLLACEPGSIQAHSAVCSYGVDLRSGCKQWARVDWPMYSRANTIRLSVTLSMPASIWAGSYVAPWLYRACIGQGGKPVAARTMQLST